ncbi:tail fiber domain-containing protein [Klebsiella pneumoniae]
MTVSTQVSRNEYTGNGATTQYDFTFRILDKSHLLVQTLDTSENIVTLTLGTDYTVTGVNRYNGGKVVLTSALPAGYKISIERSTPVTQEASIRNQGGFFPEIHEDALDKLTMLVQQAYGWWSGLSLRKPSWLANYYDALNNRIRNLRDPSQDQDAVTKSYADGLYDGAISYSDAQFERTLRVPESSVGVIPGVAARKNHILAFNSTGNPITVLPESGSAADVLIDLASSEDGLGSYMVNFKRNPLAAAISTAVSVAMALSSLNVSVWEFRDLVTDRPDAEDQNTWDWSPAIQAAYNNIGTYLPYIMGTNTRHASATLQFPPGYYRCSEQVQADFSSYSGYVYGRPKVTITGYGASIGCGVEQDYAWVIKGTLLNLSGLDFVTDPTVNYAYGLKLGDENKTTSNYAVTGVIRDVRGFNLTKFIVCGWAFDMRIEGIYATGFKQDPSVSEPATAFEILKHVSDNCNNITIIRPQFETTNTKNYRAFRIIGNSTLSTHHDIHIWGGHFESHQWGIRLISIEADTTTSRPAITRSSFNGMTLLENGADGDTTAPASTNLIVLEQTHSCAFRSCNISTTNTTTNAYDPLSHKSLIKYSGSAMRLLLDSCYFVTAFAGVAGSSNNRNMYSVVDTTEHSSGRYSLTYRDCTINNFATTVSNGCVMAGGTNGSRKIIESISDDGTKWSLGYTTNDAMTGTVADMITVSNDGVVIANSFAATNFDSSSAIRIGYNNTTPGQRSINFYGAGTTTLTGQVYGNSAGSVTVTSTNNIFLSPNGGSGETMYTGNLKPNATGSYSLGTSSFYPNNIYSQNAVTVVSDVNYKANVKVLSEEEEYQTLISAVGSLPFSAWQLKSAIAEKGADSARWHVGVIAQQVKSAITDAGLDWTKYGLITYESFSQEVTKGDDGYYYPVVDEEEAPKIPVNACGYIDAIDGADSVITADDGTITYTREIYMLRMEEFFTLRMAYIERKFS